MTLKSILVATDFGDAARSALAYGRELARAFDAQLDVLHVMQKLQVYVAAADVTAFPTLQQGIEHAAQDELEHLLRNSGLEPSARAILRTSDAPAAAITQYARDETVDLIVLGTHGRRGVAHLLLGSVAEQVVRTAPCPVLTVRHPEHEFISGIGAVNREGTGPNG